jgi:hypothetical protein
MNDTGVIQDSEFLSRRLGETMAFAGREVSGWYWLAILIPVLVLGLVYVVAMYIRDSRSIRWYWCVPLAALRLGVYAAIAAVFLLPAIQLWERSEKRSRVVVLLDITPSVTDVSDDRPPESGGTFTPKPRITKVIDFLTDEKVAFLKKLTEKNPVSVYRFGTRLDDEAQTFTPEQAAWSAAEWNAWIKYDFKPWLLRGLSDAGKEVVRKSPAFGGDDPGTPEWAVDWLKRDPKETIPATLTPEDQQVLTDNRSKLDKRIDLARAIVQGTNVPDSVLAAVNREAANMVQGVVVISDGRSNLGSDATMTELKKRATDSKTPIFTVAVGENIQVVSIVITDVQAPDRAPPDEPFKIVVEADGVGLSEQEVEVKLGLYLPNRDPKKDAPDHELDGKLIFQRGEPPHGQAEFVIDPLKLPENLTVESKENPKKRELVEGAWAATARIAKDRREIFPEKEHVRERPAIQVLKKPLRVLLMASGPSLEYQTLRTLLVREVQANRAELSIWLQNEGGATGKIVQDVEPNRLLNRFPTRLDTTARPDAKPEDKYYNLNEYDLIIAFDPDWSEVTPEQTRNLQTWVENLGGGLIVVGGPIHTFQLARAEGNDRLKPLLDIFPVLPDDIVVRDLLRSSKYPRRLLLKPNPEFDVLKLDEDRPDDPVAGWELFFTGKEKYTPDADETKDLNPRRGFYSYYPVKMVKPGASVLMEYVERNDRGERVATPYLVVNQAVRGRAAFLGSGEVWRLRTYNPEFYQRFWVKFARYVSGNRDLKAARGRILMNKEFVSGAPIRLQPRILGPDGQPYPEGAIEPKFKVVQYGPDNEKKAERGPFPLAPKKGAGGFDGYYQGQVQADPRVFPPGDFRYRVVIDVPDSAGETLESDFIVKKSDPERDNARPDLDALRAMAGELEMVLPRIPTNSPAAEVLRAKLPNVGGQQKLFFALDDRQALEQIPACMTTQVKQERNRGPVRDLWDKGVNLPLGLTGETNQSRSIGWVLLLVVGLLSTEWLIRKLLRLA